jgi:hypothetical protein
MTSADRRSNDRAVVPAHLPAAARRHPALLPTRSGLPWLALALYTALAIANRGSIPVGGPLYFVIVAFVTALGLGPFVLDRWVGRRMVGWPS